MNTRDPSSGAGDGPLPNPTSPGDDAVREPTESLNLSPEEQAAAVLALGTHEPSGAVGRPSPSRSPSRRPITAIESPGARAAADVIRVCQLTSS